MVQLRWFGGPVCLVGLGVGHSSPSPKIQMELDKIKLSLVFGLLVFLFFRSFGLYSLGVLVFWCFGLCRLTSHLSCRFASVRPFKLRHGETERQSETVTTSVAACLNTKTSLNTKP